MPVFLQTYLLLSNTFWDTGHFARAILYSECDALKTFICCNVVGMNLKIRWDGIEYVTKKKCFVNFNSIAVYHTDGCGPDCHSGC